MRVGSKESEAPALGHTADTRMGFWFLPLTVMLGQTVGYEMSLAGTPVGWVRVELDGHHLRYESEHVFRRARAHTQVDYSLDAQGRAENESMPSARWLLRPPPPGCAAVFDEVTKEKGEGCATPVQGGISQGTLLRQPFNARYGKDGLLEHLTLGITAFRRVEKVPTLDASRARLFSEGFSIEGTRGPLRLSSQVEGVKPAEKDVQAAAEEALNPGACLVLSQAAIRENPGKFQLRLGLVADEGRAWPHAWLKEMATGNEVDLSAYAGEPGTRLPAGDYLVFPNAEAGRLYVALLEGKLRVWRGGVGKKN